MFSPKQRALIFIQLVNMWSVVAEFQRADHRDVLVSRGETALFTCNISKNHPTTISWTKDRFFITFSFSSNKTSSNFSSSVTIDTNMPTDLSINNTQPDDAGLYTCDINDLNGHNNMTWNLTVTDPKESSSSKYSLLFTLLPAIGLSLCLILTAVLFCRKNQTRNQNQDLNQNETWSCVEYRHVQLGEKEVPRQTSAIWRKDDEQKSSED